MKRKTAIIVIFYTLLFLVKCYWVRGSEVWAAHGGTDQYTYLTSGSNYYWGVNYNMTAFCRLPLYPLFVGFISFSGIPYRIGIELIYALAAFIFARGVRRYADSEVAGLVAFSGVVFLPITFYIFNSLLTESMEGAVLLALLGFWLGARGQQKVPFWGGQAIPMGVCLSAWLLCRDELPLVVATSAMMMLADIGHAWKGNQYQWTWNSFGLRRFFQLHLTAIAFCMIVVIAVCTLNFVKFGQFVRSDMQMPSYCATYRGLLRIDVSHESVQPYVAISRAAREQAYRASPAFGALKEFLEDPHSPWRTVSAENGIKNDIGSGWFYWALRDAVAKKLGRESSQQPASVDAYFTSIATQLDEAFAQRRLPTRLVLSDFLNPNIQEWMVRLPASVRRMAHLHFSQCWTSLGFEDPLLAAEYDAVCHRRVSLVKRHIPEIASLKGWMVVADDTVINYAILDEKDQVIAVCVPHARPDVAAYYGRSKGGSVWSSGFDFGAVRCDLRAGNYFLAAITPKGLRKVDIMWRDGRAVAGVLAGVDVAIDEYKFTRNNINEELSVGVGYFFGAGALIGLILITARGRRVASELGYSLLIVVSGMTGLRILFYAIIDASSWDCYQPRYLFPTQPLAFAVVTVYLVELGRRLLVSSKSK